ncbi:MAG: hypothetical protein ABL958_11145, partial [Bdellovibrionia bacterium]
MMIIRRRHTSIVIASLALTAVFISFQNCGEVAFVSSLSEEQQRMQLLCRNGCWEGELSPEQNVYKPEVKVLLVVDNSFSMSQAQEKLATGVRSLIDGLKGFGASYYVYTTTQEGDKAASITKTGCRKTLNGVVTELPSCPAGAAMELGATYASYQKTELAESLASGTDFKIAQGAADSDFLILKDKLGAVISGPSGVGVGGSDSERGICTLVRAAYEEGPSRVFNPGDVAVFGLISDEDDFSSVANCISKRETVTDCT